MKKILKNVLRWGTFGVCWFAFIGIVKAIFSVNHLNTVNDFVNIYNLITYILTFKIGGWLSQTALVKPLNKFLDWTDSKGWLNWLHRIIDWFYD